MSKRTFLVGACLLALVVGLAACGDDDGDETGAGSAPTTEEASPEATSEDIVAVAAATPELSTLVDAVTAADLVETLEEPGPYTVFAPTNSAFEALGGQLETLLEPKNKGELAEILTYHVVPGELTAAELQDGQMLETVQGDSLEVSIEGEEVTVDGAAVASADVEASNGVVHVIDAVMLPGGAG